MNKQEVAVLTFKAMSLGALIKTINEVYSLLYFLFYQNQLSSGDKYSLLMAAIPSLLLALSAIILWFGAPFLSNLVFKQDETEVLLNCSLADIQKVAFSAIGLFLLATSLPAVVEIILVLQMASNVERGSISMVPTIVEILIKGLLGLWLLFGSHGLVNFLKYLDGKRGKF